MATLREATLTATGMIQIAAGTLHHHPIRLCLLAIALVLAVIGQFPDHGAGL